jgi:beta-lactamase class A
MVAGGDVENAKQVENKAAQELAPFSGRTAFLFAELTPEGPRPLFASRADEKFAIGSSFKLFILGRLAVEVNERRRLLENVMRLQANLIGPPSSELADWPTQSPVTLQTLALKMITISDNTATDHLLHLLGRENAEEQMAKMGHHHPEWNRPLLST